MSFILGNGFNYLIENIIRSIPVEQIPGNLHTDQAKLANKIREISGLWARFDNLFRDLKGNYPHLSDEELIRMIYTVLDFLSGMQGFEKVLTADQINQIKNTFNFLLIDQIKEITEEFRTHQEDEGYKDLKRLFPDFGQSFNSLLEQSEVERCDFFTTNYDGILDTLMTYPDRRGFLSVDGFGAIPDDPNYLKLYDENLDGIIRIFHIHGSYRFERIYGTTYKSRSNFYNNDPVIIFNNPELKEELIHRDTVLRTYLHTLEHSLKDSDKLVIMGNSMRNEPHIKQHIKRYFNNQDKHLYVCSRNPTPVKRELGIFFNHTIHERSTNGINSIANLIEFIDEIIKHAP